MKIISLYIFLLAIGNCYAIPHVDKIKSTSFPSVFNPDAKAYENLSQEYAKAHEAEYWSFMGNIMKFGTGLIAISYMKKINANQNRKNVKNCIEGNCNNGVGVLHTAFAGVNRIYWGEFKYGRPNGIGSWYLLNNEKYQLIFYGKMTGGIPDGFCVYYELGFDPSRLNSESVADYNMSKGIEIDNELYVGFVKSSIEYGVQKKGIGTQLDSKGNPIYTGEWSENKKNGIGKLFFENGKQSKYEGTFINDKPVRAKEFNDMGELIYEGEFKNFQKHGIGKLYKDGRNIYSGKFKYNDISIVDGEQETLLWTDDLSLKYKGDLIQTTLYNKGKGVYRFKDGHYQKGSWHYRRNGMVESRVNVKVFSSDSVRLKRIHEIFLDYEIEERFNLFVIPELNLVGGLPNQIDNFNRDWLVSNSVFG